LAVPDMSKLAYVFDAVAQIKRALDERVPLIGFAGSPFTLACYMIEGGASADFATVRRMIYARPDLLAHLTALNARAVTAYLNEQITAGVDAVMLFDTWGGLLSASAYRQFSLSPMRDVIAGLAPAPDGRRIPVIVFTKGGGTWLDDIASIGADGVGLDWTVDIAAARAAVGARVALQGNLDPLVLLTDPTTVAREAAAIVRAAGPQPGHIFNLGHGIVPGTPPDNVAALVEAVHAISRATRATA
jgi:uroporphyrinogen decarboxylase